MTKKILLPTVALFVICLVCTVLLALANDVTAPIIDELAAKTEIESRLEVLSTAKSFKDGKSGNISYVTGLNDKNEVEGYVFVTQAKSYGGQIKVMTGVDRDGKVTGVKLLEINDTVGLGMNAKKDSFRNQYIGLFDKITVQKNGADKEKNEIQALTGATISSNAVTDAVNSALADYNTVTGNGGAK